PRSARPWAPGLAGIAGSPRSVDRAGPRPRSRSLRCEARRPPRPRAWPTTSDPGYRPRGARRGCAIAPRAVRWWARGSRPRWLPRPCRTSHAERGQRVGQPLPPRLLLGQPRSLLGDHILGRLGQKVGVAELALECRDLLLGLADVLGDPGLLGRHVDE